MSTYVPAALRRKIHGHFDAMCAYCQTVEALTVTIFEIEHIIPRAAGGKTEFDNLCLSCPSCNRYKSDQTHGANDSPLFHPHRNSWDDHFGWSIDGTTVVGLTRTGLATIEALRINRPQMIRVRGMWVALDEHPPT